MRNIKILVLALLLTSLAVAPAYAKRHGWGSRCDPDRDRTRQVERLRAELELTAQQQREIQEIISEGRQALAGVRAERAANRSNLHELLASEVADEGHLRALVHRQAELQADRMLAQHAIRARIKQVLTPAQQAKHDDLRQQRMARKGPSGGKGVRHRAGSAGSEQEL